MIVKRTQDLIKEVRRIQKKKGLTDEKIAFYGNLSKGTVSQLLSGQSKDFTFRTIIKIAKALDCALDLSFRDEEH